MDSIKTLKKYWFYFLPAVIWIVHLIIIFFILPTVPIKDERTFYDAAISFRNVDLQGVIDLLKSYNAPQTPLVFIIGGLLLKITGTIVILRILNSILILASLILFCKSIEIFNINSFKYKLFFVTTLLLNPYFHFAAVTFYTDGLYLLFISLSAFLIISNKESILLFISFVLLLLTRQFGIFLPAGYFTSKLDSRLPFLNKKAFYTIITLSGLLFMVILWKDIMPDNNFREMMSIIRQKYGYILPYIPAYIFSAVGFYLSPLYLFFINKVIKKKLFYVGGFITSLFYIIFPVHQNFTNKLFQDYVTTLGFYHNSMLAMFGHPAFNIILILFAFISGGWIFVLLSSDKIPRTFRTIIVFYFAMNFFNIQAWDKYIIDIEMILILTITYFLSSFIKSPERAP